MFAKAEAAFGRGDYAAARTAARAVLAAMPGVAAAAHLLALCERRLGHDDAALEAFAVAIKGDPGDPQIRNNFGNLLGDLGRSDEALVQYRAAVAAVPGFVDAWYNLGVTASGCGRLHEARTALEQAARLAPHRAATWQALGLALRELGDSDAAVAALDRAVALQPQAPAILHARARAEAERGGDALPWFTRARSAAPADLPLVQGQAAALRAADDDAAAAALLRSALAQVPDWIAGHDALASLRWQAGDAQGFMADWDAAIAARPRDADLRLAQIRSMSRAGRWPDVARRIAAARRAIPDDGRVDVLAAVTADESGDTTTAATLFARIDSDDPSVGLVRVRHLLRTGATLPAAVLAEQLTAGPEAVTAWAYLALAWRLLGDARHDWLESDPRLVSTPALDLPDLAGLATSLRALHVSRAHPLDQSLRGGTQTDGPLFHRGDPHIVRLRREVERAVADHVARLPPPDPAHPTLGRARTRFRFSGSWSVRLTAAGFHVAHIHGDGWLSSACHIVLPALGDGADGETAGWLALGQAPPELGLDLPPLRLVKPEPGRLVLFPATMWHATRPFPAGERLSIACDIVPSA